MVRYTVISPIVALLLAGAGPLHAQVEPAPVPSCVVDSRGSIQIDITGASLAEALEFNPPNASVIARYRAPGHWVIEGIPVSDPASLSINRSGYEFERLRPPDYFRHRGGCLVRLAFRAHATWRLHVTSSTTLTVQHRLPSKLVPLHEGRTPFDSRPMKQLEPAHLTIFTAIAPVTRFERDIRYTELVTARDQRLEYNEGKIKDFICKEQSNGLRCRRIFRSLTNAARVPEWIRIILIPSPS